MPVAGCAPADRTTGPGRSTRLPPRTGIQCRRRSAGALSALGADGAVVVYGHPRALAWRRLRSAPPLRHSGHHLPGPVLLAAERTGGQSVVHGHLRKCVSRYSRADDVCPVPLLPIDREMGGDATTACATRTTRSTRSTRPTRDGSALRAAPAHLLLRLHSHVGAGRGRRHRAALVRRDHRSGLLRHRPPPFPRRHAPQRRHSRDPSLAEKPRRDDRSGQRHRQHERQQHP